MSTQHDHGSPCGRGTADQVTTNGSPRRHLDEEFAGTEFAGRATCKAVARLAVCPAEVFRPVRGVRIAGVGVVRRVLAVCGLVAGVLLACVLAAQPAHAHAVLIDTGPADGAALDRAPGEVWLRFNEPVGLPPESVRVFDASGERVDTGAAGHDRVRSIVRADLGDSVYTVTWQVLSEDTHPIRGAWSFTVGDPGDVQVVPITQLPGGGSQAGWDVLAAGVPWLTYLGALLAVGVAGFLLLAHDRRTAEVRRLLRLLRVGAAVAVVATVVAVPVQTAVATGQGARALVTAELLPDTLETTYGGSVVVRLAGLVLLLAEAGWLWRRWARVIAVLGAVTTLVSFLFAGHTVTTRPRWLIIGADLAQA